LDRRMIRIAGTLVRAGYDVCLVGRRLPASQPLVEQMFRQHRLVVPVNKGKFFYLLYNIRLWWFLMRTPFDALNVVDLDTLPAGRIAAFLKKKPLLYDAHEYFTEVPELVGRPIVRQVWLLAERFLLPGIRYAYTVSGSIADRYREQYGVAFEVVRNLPRRQAAVEPIRRYRPGNAPFILLYQGMLNMGRGLEVAISAMRDLEGVELWLVGEGDCSAALRRQAASEAVSGRVRFLGIVPPDQLPAVTRQAHAGLNLLENSSPSYYFSLANKTFDYVQAGIPGICMNFPEYARLNADEPVFVLLEELSIAALRSAVERLRSDEAQYERLCAACRQRAAALSWESEERTLLSLYRRAIPLGDTAPK
jgi:glycosyltransferase involved in cell wall biosynthesis